MLQTTSIRRQKLGEASRRLQEHNPTSKRPELWPHHSNKLFSERGYESRLAGGSDTESSIHLAFAGLKREREIQKIDAIMSDVKEELEPLFDYSRVQPVAFNNFDDYDSSPTLCSKRKKSDKVEGVKKDEKEAVHILDDEDEDVDEWDWLPPPPKMRSNRRAKEEDETIKELRLKKQQLESFTQSAQDVLRSVEEEAKRDYHAKANANANSEPADKPIEPSSQRTKIVISIQDKKGLKQFRIYKDEKFGKLFKLYAEKNKHDLESLTFCFDGDKISPMATPEDLDMEDDDIVEMHVK